MKASHGFLILTVGLTAAGYLLGFSDLGYLKQSRLKQELRLLKEEIRGLEQENAALGDDYVRMQERLASVGGEAAPAAADISPEGEAVILKFEEPPRRDSPATAHLLLNPDDRMSLVEARVLFLTAMFFFAVVGFYVVDRLER